MLKRKIEDELISWKARKKKKVLVVRGARQVGKTYSVTQFGHAGYEEVLEINFKRMPSAAEIFSGDLDVDTMILAMRFRFPELKLQPGRTLIFLDEIQECEEAITSLKFWTMDGRYDVIASGSLLGIDYKRASSYPVGYVEYLTMYGLDFEEFLWAMGTGPDMIGAVRELFEKRKVIPEAVNSQMMKYFRLYMALGGMPEVIQSYTDTKDFREADRIQRDILEGYRYDIAHYALPNEKIKAEKCFLSLSRQLLDKENHKFQYKEVEHGGRAQKFMSSVEWLISANIASASRKVTKIEYELADYEEESSFRLYTTDLSLLIAMRDYSLKQHIVENTLVDRTRGGLYECAVADILIKKGYALHYYKNDTLRREIEFLIEKDGGVVPIEVKSGKSKATSLNAVMKSESGLKEAYKFMDGNVGVGESGIVTAPLYTAMFL